MTEITLTFKCDLDNHEFKKVIRQTTPQVLDVSPPPCPICRSPEHVTHVRTDGDN